MPKIVGIFIYISREIFIFNHIKQERIEIVSNLRFISGTIFMLTWVEHEKKFNNLGTGHTILQLKQAPKMFILIGIGLT